MDEKSRLLFKKAFKAYYATPEGKEKVKRYQLKFKYGLTIEEVERKKQDQGYKCKLCNKVKRLVIDHNHITKKVRSMLCYRCNIFIGYIEGTPEIVEKAQRYIRGE